MKKNLSSTTFKTGRPNQSLAYKYGVSIKENCSLGGIGMNPNLNIEDEYIENLLKQIHFMNMEIKLIKEKQASSDGNALWGVINKTNQPMVGNIVESSQKYQQMKKNYDKEKHNLQKDIVSMGNNQAALLAEIEFLEGKKKGLEERQQQWEQESQLKHQAVHERLIEEEAKLNNICRQKEEEQRQVRQLSATIEAMTRDENREKHARDCETLKIHNDETIEQIIERETDSKITETRQKIEELKKIFEQNLQYAQGKQESVVLKAKLNNLDKGIMEAKFELKQLDESIRMAEYEKEQEIIERKKATEDLEQNKLILFQILQVNGIRKDRETIQRKKESPEILKAEQQTVKLQKVLEETKRKLFKASQANNSIISEVSEHEKNLEKLKSRYQASKIKYVDLSAQNSNNENQLLQLQAELRSYQDEYDKVMTSDIAITHEIFELDRQLQYQKTKHELLTQNKELRELFNSIKMEDLQRIIQKNNDLNATVSNMMEKWQEMKQFSRS